MIKSIYTLLILLCSVFAFGQFPSNPVQWPTPTGGTDYIIGADTTIYGFYNISGSPVSTTEYGAQTWHLVDMNGDGKPDLVVTAYIDLVSGKDIQFNAASNPYWNVYLNTGAGFSSTAIQWSTPMGGVDYGDGAINYGFYNISGSPFSGIEYGAQQWDLVDVNGDGKPDLVVTAYLDSTNHGNPSQFNAASNPYWNVYLNTGAGFSATAVQWSTPKGGLDYADGAINYGFYNTSGSPLSDIEYGAQIWHLVDMNGDGKPDLVVTSYLDSASRNNLQFDAASNPYWNVYLNTGTGFSSTASQWSSPSGGLNYFGGEVTDGFYDISGAPLSYIEYGAQTWNLVDVNGDGKPDLVVTSYADSASRGNLQFNAASNPYWNVYLNTGSGFSSTASQWSTPMGGFDYHYEGITTIYGFYTISRSTYSTSEYGAQIWDLVDMNGDGKPDLVVTSYIDSANGGNSVQYNALSNPYWNIYLNTGFGFSSTAIQWFTPMGGTDYHVGSVTTTFGFYNISGSPIYSTEYGAQTWDVVDMNGDGKPDLVVTSSLDSAAGGNFEFDATSNPYWNVYLNSNTTGISEITQVSPQCMLYPNPNNGNFTLQFTDASERSIEVYDMMGRIIIPTTTMQNRQQFNLGAVNAGIYLLRITQSDEVRSVKFVVE